jgi:hypothetical protein
MLRLGKEQTGGRVSGEAATEPLASSSSASFYALGCCCIGGRQSGPQGLCVEL